MLVAVAVLTALKLHMYCMRAEKIEVVQLDTLLALSEAHPHEFTSNGQLYEYRSMERRGARVD